MLIIFRLFVKLLRVRPSVTCFGVLIRPFFTAKMISCALDETARTVHSLSFRLELLPHKRVVKNIDRDEGISLSPLIKLSIVKVPSLFVVIFKISCRNVSAVLRILSSLDKPCKSVFKMLAPYATTTFILY